MFSAFFIDRPKFAFVISILITLAGLISLFTLPIDQYPEITPPVVQVSASYPGANAQVVETTVAQPLEQQVNGVEGMIYIASTSGNDGTLNMQVTFEVGADPDIAQVNVQNRVALAQPQLPEEVVRQGISVRKQSTNLLLVINLTSPNGTYDSLYLSNYATINLLDALSRVPGVGQATIFGARDYSMRMWLDAGRMASLGIATSDVVRAVREQNVQVAAGQIGAAPSDPDQQFQYTIRTQGRLDDVGAFETIIVRAHPDGSSVRIKDVARVELGARNYASFGLLNGNPSANIGIYQLPGANALAVAGRVQQEVTRLSQRFPRDLQASILYDTTRFVDESIKEVVKTLLEALILVVLVVYVFLQDWRMTVIPSIAIPVSLIGTFAALNALGFSINVITLFGLVLSIGIVVDDAIIVVENVQRKLAQGLTPRDAAMQAMREVTSPILATSLVLLAVFVPVGFIPGITGKLYQEFALTIAVAVLISTINALTLSPALCATVLRPHREARSWFFRSFNRGFDAVLARYARSVRVLVRRVGVVLILFVCLVGATALRLPEAALGVPAGGRSGIFLRQRAAATCRGAHPHRRGDDGSRRHSQGDAGHPQRRRDRRLQLPHRYRVAEQRRVVRRSGAVVRSRYAGAAGPRHPAEGAREVGGDPGGDGRRLQPAVDPRPRHHRRLRFPAPGSARRQPAGTGRGAARPDRPGKPRAGAAQRLLHLPGGRPADLGGRGSREGEEAGRAARRDLRHAADPARLLLRQRLQQVRPGLPGHFAGRAGVPAASGGHSAPLRA